MLDVASCIYIVSTEECEEGGQNEEGDRSEWCGPDEGQSRSKKSGWLSRTLAMSGLSTIRKLPDVEELGSPHLK